MINPYEIVPGSMFQVFVADVGTSRFKKEIKTADALVTMTYAKYGEAILAQARNLKVISTMSVGYDHIDLEYCKKRGIKVANTPYVLAEATADLAWALILTCSRRIVEADRFTRQGKFRGWHPELFLGRDIAGKTLGVVGAGEIGSAVIRRATGFNMNVLYWSRNRKSVLEKKYGAKKVNLETLLRKSDIISLNCALTPQTFHLIGDKEFKLMKKGVILVNTARGKVIDEQKVIKYLKNGKICCAGIDVYGDNKKMPVRLSKMKNVVILPHIGSATIETRIKMTRIALQNIKAILTGKGSAYLVDT